MAKDFTTFCKEKGFIYLSSEIYGGIAGFYDYGHLGTKIKQNFQNLWRNYFLSLNDNFHEIEACNIMPENVFKASGHLENFIDPIAKCPKCGHAERADHLIEKHLKQRVEGFSPEKLTELLSGKNLTCPECKTGVFDKVEIMNLMFKINVGVGSKQIIAYLRPETAQSPFVNFKLQFELLRKKLPLGLATVGKAYRNEISPRNMTLRLREFTQAELQIFFNPNKINEHENFEEVKDYKLLTILKEDRKDYKTVERTASDLVKLGYPKFYVYHLAKVQQFYLEKLHFLKDNFRLLLLIGDEKAFYNKYHFDIEAKVKDHDWIEIGGIHYRTDHDLKGHEKISKQSMEVTDNDQKFIPHVLELSFGVDRNIYTILDFAYNEDTSRGNLVLDLPKSVVPYVCAVFPLVKNKPKLLQKAKEVYDLLKPKRCLFDMGGSIGRRYARADEIGIKKCITVDFESLEDNCVTIRDIKTTKQERVKINDLLNYF